MEPTNPTQLQPPAPAHDEHDHDEHDDDEHVEHDHDEHDHDEHDDRNHHEHGHDHGAHSAARHPLDRLSRLAVDVGAGVVLVQAVFLILAIVQGLSLRRQGPSSFDGDLLHRIGIVFSTSVNLQNGLALVLAVALVSVPLALPVASRPLRGLRSAALVAVAVLAAVVSVGTILGVRASLLLAEQSSPTVSAYQRWELTAYLVGTLGTALVAFVAALAAMPGAEEPRS